VSSRRPRSRHAFPTALARRAPSPRTARAASHAPSSLGRNACAAAWQAGRLGHRARASRRLSCTSARDAKAPRADRRAWPRARWTGGAARRARLDVAARVEAVQLVDDLQHGPLHLVVAACAPRPRQPPAAPSAPVNRPRRPLPRQPPAAPAAAAAASRGQHAPEQQLLFGLCQDPHEPAKSAS